MMHSTRDFFSKPEPELTGRKTLPLFPVPVKAGVVLTLFPVPVEAGVVLALSPVPVKAGVVLTLFPVPVITVLAFPLSPVPFKDRSALPKEGLTLAEAGLGLSFPSISLRTRSDKITFHTIPSPSRAGSISQIVPVRSTVQSR